MRNLIVGIAIGIVVASLVIFDVIRFSNHEVRLRGIEQFLNQALQQQRQPQQAPPTVEKK